MRHAISLDKTLDEVSLADMQRTAPAIGPDVLKALTLEASVSRRNVTGGTGPEVVASALRAAKARLDAAR